MDSFLQQFLENREDALSPAHMDAGHDVCRSESCAFMGMAGCRGPADHRDPQNKGHHGVRSWPVGPSLEVLQNKLNVICSLASLHPCAHCLMPHVGQL